MDSLISPPAGELKNCSAGFSCILLFCFFSDALSEVENSEIAVSAPGKLASYK